MPNHRLPITISIGGDSFELTAEIEFSIRPGSPASWTDPGDPAELEIESVGLVALNMSVAGGHESYEPAPEWLKHFIASSDAVYTTLGEASDWGENDGPDPDDLRDARRDDKLTDPGQT